MEGGVPVQKAGLTDRLVGGIAWLRGSCLPVQPVSNGLWLAITITLQAINAENEEHFAGVAASSGGRLAVLKPPVTATADERQRQQQHKACKK